MNKKNNRKGFTTVELVIVIAVIAILATVLIPTFSNLIGKAEESNALQAASSAFKNYTIENATTFSKETIYIFVDGGYVFKIVKGEWANESKPLKEAEVDALKCTDGVLIRQPNKDLGDDTADFEAGFVVFDKWADETGETAGVPDTRCDSCGLTEDKHVHKIAE